MNSILRDLKGDGTEVDKRMKVKSEREELELTKKCIEIEAVDFLVDNFVEIDYDFTEVEVVKSFVRDSLDQISVLLCPIGYTRSEAEINNGLGWVEIIRDVENGHMKVIGDEVSGGIKSVIEMLTNPMDWIKEDNEEVKDVS